MEEHPWDEVGVVRTPGRRDRFVCTDNLTGWFEGYTHSASLGRGYAVRNVAAFLGWSSSVEGRRLDRDSQAVSDTVFPWGHRVEYPDGTREELLVHSGRRVLSLRVSGPAEATYRIQAQVGSPLPGVTCDQVEHTSPRSTEVHLVFAETPEEREQSLRTIEPSGCWEAEVTRRWQTLAPGFTTSDKDYNKALFWAAASARSFVTNEFGTGIWAGLPWFKDNWGRDTFIALPGTLLCTGDFSTARLVLENFARYQNVDPGDKNYGRVPNRVNSSEILYNTVDGTPWMVRELEEYLHHTGDLAFAMGLRSLVRRYVDGALASFVGPEGLLDHDDADTWMDARIEGRQPWSPRGNRAVEVQALWIEALEVGRRLALVDGDEAEATFYTRLALQARGAFQRRFVVQGRLADRVAADGTPDLTLRPNALLLARINEVLPVDEAVLEATVRQLLTTLMTPWGILSLDPSHRNFHPRHENPGRWHKDAAYHNGTIWGWNAGFAVSALVRFGWQDRAWELTRELGRQILEDGCVGTMSELLDAVLGPDGRPVPSGTFSQSWSVAEFVRNAWQDFLGFRPNLPGGELGFRPALPRAWTTVTARVPYGPAGDVLEVRVDQEDRGPGGVLQRWAFVGTGGPSVWIEVPGTTEGRHRVAVPGGPRATVEVRLPPPRTDAPNFTVPVSPPGGWSVERSRGVLAARILGGGKDR